MAIIIAILVFIKKTTKIVISIIPRIILEITIFKRSTILVELSSLKIYVISEFSFCSSFTASLISLASTIEFPVLLIFIFRFKALLPLIENKVDVSS